MHLRFEYRTQLGDHGMLAFLGCRRVLQSNETHLFFLAEVELENPHIAEHLEEHIRKLCGGDCAVIGTNSDCLVRVFFSRKINDDLRNPVRYLHATKSLFLDAYQEAEAETLEVDDDWDNDDLDRPSDVD